MGDVVNLRRARKAKAREQEAEAAAANRVRTGRSAAEREAARLRQAHADRVLDGAKLPKP